MNSHQMEAKLKTAVEHAAPHRLEAVLSACEKGEKRVSSVAEPARPTHRWKRFALAAAAMLLVTVGGVLGFSLGRQGESGLTAVMFDVNPSVELVVDRDETVRRAVALNADGEKVLGGMRLENTNLETAVNALVGAFLRDGYLDELQNAILISVESRGEAGARLEAELSGKISALLESGGLNAAVFSQTVAADDTLAALAERNGISLGKAALIQDILSQDSALRFEDLSPLTITELAILTESRSLAVSTVAHHTGDVSYGGYIGPSAALQSACGWAGIGPDECQGPSVELDCEDGVMVYEVEFCYGGRAYDCHVDAAGGSVTRHETGACDHGSHHSTGLIGGTHHSEEHYGGGTAVIGEAAALHAALLYWQLEYEELPFHTERLDYEDGAALYEVEICYGGTEYECEVDAYTGTVLRGETGVCGHPAHMTSAPAADIGEAAAIQAACGHLGVGAQDILDCHTSLEDGCYEVGFCHNGTEYEYEINRTTGAVIGCETDWCDHPAHMTSAPAADIGEAAAIQAACGHLGVGVQDVLDCHTSLEDGCYEVGFCHNGTEYEYEIHRTTGAVISCETDWCDHAAHHASVPAADIGETAAIQAACGHLGVGVQDILGCHASLEDDCYEVTFCHGGTEYEYEIHRTTGAVIGCETGHCGHHAHSGHHRH